MDDASQEAEGFTRRNVLQKGAATTGAMVAVGAGASATVAADKQGGRGQVDGDVRENVPFTVTPKGDDNTVDRHASCMSGQSAMQVYLTYDIHYNCDTDDDDATLYVLPDEAPLDTEEVYKIRSATPCRDSDLTLVAFGPSNEPCGSETSNGQGNSPR